MINTKPETNIKHFRGGVNVRRFKKSFQGGMCIFNNISFDIEPGEIVSIVGPSGSGKSTLLRSIIGLDNNFGGEILIDGKDNHQYLKEKRISVVLQKFSNFKWLNVRDNIETALNGKYKDDQKESIVSSILEEVDLIGFDKYYINQLSGGMQQRVAVARALVQDADMIAMDEPFASLDMKIRENLQLVIKSINEHHKKTILFVTHDIEEAIFISDKIVVLTKPPVEKIKVYGKNVLKYKSETDSSVKYSAEFVELRRSIEKIIINS